MSERSLDVICLGRSSVDLYGEQIGGRLEDMQTFAKYVGGCPTNIAVGTARLGLRSGLITRVGDEQMGRFIVETLNSEGVDTSRITFDPNRLTALVILGIRDRETFPHIFYRPDCADMAIRCEHIDEEYIASAKALLVTGTHLSRTGVEETSRTAIAYARATGTKVVLDIDYRPVLWGLTGHAMGDNRFVADSSITQRLQSVLTDADLIVGTEEEIHIAGGFKDTREALRAIRRLSNGIIVCKRGALGCIVYDATIPENLEDGISFDGCPVAVLNTLGAGDGFMSGFLRGWLADEDLETCCRYANGVGALVVSRNGCAPAMPSWSELRVFLDNEFSDADPDSPGLDQIHRTTTRQRSWPTVQALAFDHRFQFEQLANRHNADYDRISKFKSLIADAFCNAANDVQGAGAIVDSQYGEKALHRLTGNGYWIARPVEQPGSRPLRFESNNNIGLELRTWPAEHVVKCLVNYHPDDPESLRAEQESKLFELFEACLLTNHDLLLEVIPPSNLPRNAVTTARILTAIYDRGIYPDWWKLPPGNDPYEWKSTCDVIAHHDPHCRGIVILGLNAPESELAQSFDVARKQPLCKGFAVGRTIFWEAAENWFAGHMSSSEAVKTISESFERLAAKW